MILLGNLLSNRHKTITGQCLTISAGASGLLGGSVVAARQPGGFGAASHLVNGLYGPVILVIYIYLSAILIKCNIYIINDNYIYIYNIFCLSVTLVSGIPCDMWCVAFGSGKGGVTRGGLCGKKTLDTLNWWGKHDLQRPGNLFSLLCFHSVPKNRAFLCSSSSLGSHSWDEKQSKATTKE